MKTLIILGLAVILNGCIYAGEISFLPERNDLIADLSSYHIEYLNKSGPKLVKTETVTESDFAPNKMLTAYKGYSIADTKTYKRNYYTQESILAPTDAELNSEQSPLYIKADKKYNIIGQVEINGLIYAVVPNPNGNEVMLVDNNGYLFNQLGVIRNDRLVLLEAEYIIQPKDFHFEPVTTSKVVQSEMTWGFEIKYAGIKLDRIVFTVMEYNPNNDDSGEFVKYNYPNRPGEISIRGLKIRVYEANDAKIEYMIITD